MAESNGIIDIADWFQTPLGRYLLEWEQALVDELVGDVFGFHALQVGWPALQALRANRMPHRWLMTDGLEAAPRSGAPGALPVHLQADYDALPFPANSLDLVVLPHTLEQSDDAHQTLREVERVLVPDGRVIVLGFNPLSLWGLQQGWAQALSRLGLSRHQGETRPLPVEGEFIGPRRLRDWMRLLSFEVERAHFGGYRPAVDREVWLDRWARLDPVGERWWPVLGGMYATVAVKRVRGMRLVGTVRKSSLRRQAARAPAVAVRDGGAYRVDLGEGREATDAGSAGHTV